MTQPTPNSQWTTKHHIRVSTEHEFHGDKPLRSHLLNPHETITVLHTTSHPSNPNTTWLKLRLQDGSTAYTTIDTINSGFTPSGDK